MSPFERQGITLTNNNIPSRGLKYVRNQQNNYNNQNYKDSKIFIMKKK